MLGQPLEDGSIDEFGRLGTVRAVLGDAGKLLRHVRSDHCERQIRPRLPKRPEDRVQLHADAAGQDGHAYSRALGLLRRQAAHQLERRPVPQEHRPGVRHGSHAGRRERAATLRRPASGANPSVRAGRARQIRRLAHQKHRPSRRRNSLGGRGWAPQACDWRQPARSWGWRERSRSPRRDPSRLRAARLDDLTWAPARLEGSTDSAHRTPTVLASQNPGDCGSSRIEQGPTSRMASGRSADSGGAGHTLTFPVLQARGRPRTRPLASW